MNNLLQHGYQPKSGFDIKNMKPPKRGSNAIQPEENKFENFIKLMLDKTKADAIVIELNKDSKTWGMKALNYDNKGIVIDSKEAFIKANITM